MSIYGGMDPSDINNVMSAFKAKAGNPPQESSRKSTPIKDMFLVEQINLPAIWLIGRPSWCLHEGPTKTGLEDQHCGY